MHEISLCRGLLARVLEIARNHDAAAVATIRLQLDPLGRMDPQHIIEDFAHVAHGTPAQDALLEIETVALRVHCPACGMESDAAPDDPSCRRCGNGDTRILNGAGLVLLNVELAP
ncbi:MAG: hydrogenase maturation nickel metallochaperone HypA [Gammaproteobacteria bacterium]|nr:hydrogenase maturation nickel metallochaperone HypA [Gammaproteobacteria bacterium]